MKTLTVLCLLCATAFAFPATSDDDSNESEFIRPVTRKGVPSVVEIDDDDSDGESFFFPSFFRPILVNPFPQFNFGGFSNIFSSSMFRWNNLFNMLDGVPDQAKVTNSTSTVKVVDGQKITVNYTTYEKDGSVFKFQVVEVVPEKPEGEVDAEGEKPAVIGSEETTTSKDDSNEISSPKNDNNSVDNEIFREEFNRNNWEYNGGYRPKVHQSYPNNNQLPADYIDLSNDIRVNEIAKAAAINSGHFQVPPDVEVFHVPQPNYRYYTPPPSAYHYRYEAPQNRHYNSPVYNYENNRIPLSPYVDNVQYYNPPPINHFRVQPFPPINFYGYQQRFANRF